MRIRPNERQQITEILREEIEEATRKISERLTELECTPSTNTDDNFESVRRFYMDLTDNDWTDEDEQALKGLGITNEGEVKKMMREAFMRSRIYPLPSFGYLINLIKNNGSNGHSENTGSLYNPDAIAAVERERIANVLHKELTDAAEEIASKLSLGEQKAEIVRVQLEVVEGAVIGQFTPLV